MCDWIIANFPWCVEHIGRVPLPWQTVLALSLTAAAVLAYYGIGTAIEKATRRADGRAPARRNKACRAAAHVSLREKLKELKCYSDYEEYDAEWIDYEKFMNE